MMEVSGENMVFPAHAWTPWFSIFGAFSGFDTVEDCYQDMTKHIHALKRGYHLTHSELASQQLDQYHWFQTATAIVSRRRQEANVFELEISYVSHRRYRRQQFFPLQVHN
jgi:PHP family Zn ribbon phosphoesterase